MRKHVKNIANRAGIKKRVHPHLFRHSLAMNMLFKGADLWTVREQLRHSDITTTLIYVNSNTKLMANRYQVFCPNYIFEATMSQFIISGDVRSGYQKDYRPNARGGGL